ncbi:MAG: hypothetical protein A2V98_04030 [Planctomycetes bacterium RBG_16_64_12]|nr:MAG: hypothetical protein A2V98_04030 [Planctomycetes bacterium RBG_16_64_12]
MMSADRYSGERRFPTTRWSLVARAGQNDTEARREALEQILVRYLPALRAHLTCGKGLAPDRADDLLQEFVARKILDKDLIAGAEQDLGKFRTFLLTALNRFMINQFRDERAKKRAPCDGVVLGVSDPTWLAQTEASPSVAFDVAWARSIVTEAVRRMRAECQESNRMDLWGVFECRVLGPALEGSDPVDYEQLARRFGFQSPTQASNVLVTAKRMYARTLRLVVGEYARSSGEIESEIGELREILASSR